MNERIKELALKAYNDAGQGTPEELSLFMEVYSEKFAEVIVKECADIADQEAKEQKNNHGKQAADRIWHTIMNRFRVEE